MTYLFGNVEAPTIFADNDHPPRIWHHINTERGSSGGLCLDLGSFKAALRVNASATRWQELRAMRQ